MPSYDLKPPLRVAHDLPPEAPSGPGPRSPLRALIAIPVAIVIVLGLLWVIERHRHELAGPAPRFDATVQQTACPPGARGTHCYVGVVRNPNATRLRPHCLWNVFGVANGGAFPAGRLLAPGETMRSETIAIRGSARPPTLRCSAA